MLQTNCILFAVLYMFVCESLLIIIHIMSGLLTNKISHCGTGNWSEKDSLWITMSVSTTLKIGSTGQKAKMLNKQFMLSRNTLFFCTEEGSQQLLKFIIFSRSN